MNRFKKEIIILKLNIFMDLYYLKKKIILFLFV